MSLMQILQVWRAKNLLEGGFSASGYNQALQAGLMLIRQKFVLDISRLILQHTQDGGFTN